MTATLSVATLGRAKRDYPMKPEVASIEKLTPFTGWFFRLSNRHRERKRSNLTVRDRHARYYSFATYKRKRSTWLAMTIKENTRAEARVRSPKLVMAAFTLVVLRSKHELRRKSSWLSRDKS